MKYELIDETIERHGTTLHRIRYLKTGELGGWIEKEDNLSQDGKACVLENASVFGNAYVSGDAFILGEAAVFGNSLVFGNVEVYENASVRGLARVFGNAKIYGNAIVSDRARIYGNATVSDRAVVCGDDWNKTPLYIHGTRFIFSVSSKTSIKIGCTIKTINEWLASYEDEFEIHCFTEEQRTEYKLYFNLAATIYKWDVPLFKI
jgi:carbonic anhydrase/acetyltransferase-like protein (isoleucine patch superfamily)